MGPALSQHKTQILVGVCSQLTNTKIRKHVTSIEEFIHGTQQPLSRLRITLWGSRCRRGPRAWRPLLPARPLRRWWAPAWLRAGRPAHMSGRTATFGPLACLLFGGQRLRLRHGATRSGLYVGVLACMVVPRRATADVRTLVQVVISGSALPEFQRARSPHCQSLGTIPSASAAHSLAFVP